jgi:hypothetical protein
MGTKISMDDNMVGLFQSLYDIQNITSCKYVTDCDMTISDTLEVLQYTIRQIRKEFSHEQYTYLVHTFFQLPVNQVKQAV